MKVIERWIDLSKLKRYTTGNLKGKIDWRMNFNSYIEFHYNDL